MSIHLHRKNVVTKSKSLPTENNHCQGPKVRKRRAVLMPGQRKTDHIPNLYKMIMSFSYSSAALRFAICAVMRSDSDHPTLQVQRTGYGPPITLCASLVTFINTQFDTEFPYVELNLLFSVGYVS